jgi:uncharacterized protein (TIGR03067 family)
MATNDLDKEEKSKLRGVWRRVAARVDGQEVPEGPESVCLIYEGANFQVKMAEAVIEEGTSEHDPTKQPKELTLTWTAGPNQGKTGLGIYELEGDTYRACVAPPGQDRPQEFRSQVGSGHALFVLKREKSEAAGV